MVSLTRGRVRGHLHLDPVLVQFQAAIDTMDHHHLESPSLKKVAATVHLAPAYFHRRFTEAFHVTPYAYMLRKRMDKGRQWLNCTAWSVKEVAASVGHENPLYFSRLFGKHFGLSPSRMRSEGWGMDLRAAATHNAIQKARRFGISIQRSG